MTSYSRLKLPTTFLQLVPAFVCFLLLTLSLYDNVSDLSAVPLTTVTDKQTIPIIVQKTDEKLEPKPRHLIAFFLQISNTSLPQFPRLLNRLYHPQNLYVVHFDTDIPAQLGISAIHAANLTSAKHPSNVHVIPQEPINYRGVSMTLNTLSGMAYALEVSPHWRYFINLSGADYPTVTPDIIRNLFSHEGPSRIFLSEPPPSTAHEQYLKRGGHFFIDPALAFSAVKGAAFDSGSPNPLAQTLAQHIHYSQAWMVVHRAYCQFATNSPTARRLLLTLGYMLSSPEHYFATLLAASPYKADHVRTSLRLIKWKWNGKMAGQHPFALDKLYKEGDKASENLVTTPHLFARKFSRPDSKLKDVYDSRADLPERVRFVTWHMNAYLGFEKWEDKPKQV